MIKSCRRILAAVALLMFITLPIYALADTAKKPFVISSESAQRMLAAATSAAPENLPAEITACDSAASNPFDEGRFMPGTEELAIPDSAIESCRAALARYADSPRIAYELGYALYLAGRDDEAIPYYVQAAEKGWRVAMVGTTYRVDEGNAVAPDNFAENVLNSLVSQGSAHASYALGMRKLDSNTEQNKAEAIFLLEKAADKGHTDAMVQLGLVYLEGKLVPKDPRKTVAYLKAGADQGNSYAMANFADLFVDGIGVEKNAAEAVHWSRRAAAQGATLGLRNLASLYENGLGVAQDINQALQLYRRAAAAPRSDPYADGAMVDLGRIYAEGKLVPKDLPQADRWYKKAAAHGNVEAKKALEKAEFKAYP